MKRSLKDFAVGQQWLDESGRVVTIFEIEPEDDSLPISADGYWLSKEGKDLMGNRRGLVSLTLPAPIVASSESNPKTLVGRKKLPMLSVIPSTALLYLGMAMKYGAHDAPKSDGGHGYGPYNWRDQPIEAGVYVDAAIRHLLRWWEGTNLDPDSGKPELAHAMASLAILADAIENGTVIDDRPRVRKEIAAQILARETVHREGVK